MAKRTSMPMMANMMEPAEPPHGGYTDASMGQETCDALEGRTEHEPTREGPQSSYGPMHQNRTQLPEGGRSMYSERKPTIEDGVAFSEAIRADLEPS